jgi:hypothetical protein
MATVKSVLATLRTVVEDGGLSAGRWVRLPKSRRFVVDYLHFARQVPSQSVVRHCNIAEVARLRTEAGVRIGWSAVFVKACALLAQGHANLRCTFMRWPWMHLYEHPHQVGRIAVTCRHDGEDWLNFVRLIKPEQMSLPEIQRQICGGVSNPTEATPLFRLQVWFSSLPTMLRRLAWWLMLNVSGSLRVGVAGTFGVTSVSAHGAISIHPPSLGCPVISYGPIDSEGNVRLTFVYDHRQFDGGTIAEFLEEFENILNTSLVRELGTLQTSGDLKKSA